MARERGKRLVDDLKLQEEERLGRPLTDGEKLQLLKERGEEIFMNFLEDQFEGLFDFDDEDDNN